MRIRNWPLGTGTVIHRRVAVASGVSHDGAGTRNRVVRADGVASTGAGITGRARVTDTWSRLIRNAGAGIAGAAARRVGRQITHVRDGVG